VKWQNAINGVSEDPPSGSKFGKPGPMTKDKRGEVASKLRGFLSGRKKVKPQG
jgi:hypothetical protein